MLGAMEQLRMLDEIGELKKRIADLESENEALRSRHDVIRECRDIAAKTDLMSDAQLGMNMMRIHLRLLYAMEEQR